MKEAFWGVFIILLGAIGIVAINLFQDLTVTTDQNYYLMKEATKAAMEDSLDMSYYRIQGPREVPKPRIVKEAFVENLTRRFATSAVLNKDYTIIIHDIVEEPPKVSLSLISNAKDIKGGKYDVLLNIDSIYEGIYGGDVTFGKEKFPFPIIGNSGDEVIIPGEDPKVYPSDGKCPNFNGEVIECISGDLQFVGWGPAPSASSQICPEDLPNLKPQQRDAKYKSCVCGKWEEPKTEVITAPPVRSGNKSTYTWNFVKNGPINNIKESIKQDVVAGICTTGIKILIKDDRPKTILGGLECPPEGITILRDVEYKLYPRYLPLKSINRNLSWTSENGGVAPKSSNLTVFYPNKDNATIIGIRLGNDVVHVETTNKKRDYCKVRVVDLECPTYPVEIRAGAVGYAILNNNEKPLGMTYGISNANVASIDSDGKITVSGNLTQDMQISYTISAYGKSVNCPLKLKYTPTDTPEIIVPNGSKGCGVGNMSVASWSFPNKPDVCMSTLNDLDRFKAEVLKNATLTLNLCSKTTPFPSCKSGTWDSKETFNLGWDTYKSIASASVHVNESTKKYTVNVTLTANNIDWQPGLVASGCRSTNPVQTFTTSFMGNIVSSADGKVCSLERKNREIKISGSSNAIPGIQTAAYVAEYLALPGDKISWEVKGANIKSTSKNLSFKLPQNFNSKEIVIYAKVTNGDEVVMSEGFKVEVSLDACKDFNIKTNDCITVGTSYLASLGLEMYNPSIYGNAVWSLSSNLIFTGNNSKTDSVISYSSNPSLFNLSGTTTGTISVQRQTQCPNTKNLFSKTIKIWPRTEYYCSSLYPTLSKTENICIATDSHKVEFPVCDDSTQVEANRFGTECYNKKDLGFATENYSCSEGELGYNDGDGYYCLITKTTTNKKTYNYQDCPKGKSCSKYTSTKICGERGFDAPCYSLTVTNSVTSQILDTSKLTIDYTCDSGDLILTKRCTPDDSKKTSGTVCRAGFSTYNKMCYPSAPAIKNQCYKGSGRS